MSGGSFNYAYHKANDFAEELRERLRGQGQDVRGHGWLEPVWGLRVAEKLEEIAQQVDHAAALMKEVEWLYSGDIGEETFLDRVGELEKK